jgi:hypothetical protein
MPDFTFDLPGSLTFKVEAVDEEAAKAQVQRAFAHLNTVGVDLTSGVSIIAVEIGRAQSSTS